MPNPNRSPIYGQYINPDTEEIVRIISPNGALYVEEGRGSVNFSAEVNASLTDEELISAPGIGKRIVIVYGSIRTVANSGKAYFEGIIDSVQHLMGMVYASAIKSFTGIGVSVPLDENTNFRITTTTGTNDLFYYVIYRIEDVY